MHGTTVKKKKTVKITRLRLRDNWLLIHRLHNAVHKYKKSHRLFITAWNVQSSAFVSNTNSLFL
jgi:hypothetical protein